MKSHITDGLEQPSSQTLGRSDDKNSYIAFPPPSTVAENDSELSLYESEADDTPTHPSVLLRSRDQLDSLLDYESSTESVSHPSGQYDWDSGEERKLSPQQSSRILQLDVWGSEDGEQYFELGDSGSRRAESMGRSRSLSYGDRKPISSEEPRGRDPRPRSRHGSYDNNGYARNGPGSDCVDALDQKDYQHPRELSPREMSRRCKLGQSPPYRSSRSSSPGEWGHSECCSEFQCDGCDRGLHRSQQHPRNRPTCRNERSSPSQSELSDQAPQTLGQAWLDSRHEESASPLGYQNAHSRATSHTQCALSKPCEGCDPGFPHRRGEEHPEYELTGRNGDGTSSSPYDRFPTPGRQLASPRCHRDERSFSPRSNSSAQSRYRNRSPIQRHRSPSISSPHPRSRFAYGLGGGLHTIHPNHEEMKDEEGYEGDMEFNVNDSDSVVEEVSIYEGGNSGLNDGRGYDDDSFDRYGYGRAEYDRDGFELHGSDGDAYDRDEYDSLGRKRSELSAERRRDDVIAVSHQCMTQTAYYLDARNEFRYDHYGYDCKGYSRRGNSSDDYDRRAFIAPSRTRFTYSQNSTGVSKNSGPDRGRGNGCRSERSRSDRSLSPARTGKPYYSRLPDYRSMNRCGDEMEDFTRYSRLQEKFDSAQTFAQNRNHDHGYHQLRVPSPYSQRNPARHNEEYDSAMEKSWESFSRLLDLSSGRIYTKSFGFTALHALDMVQMEWENRARGRNSASIFFPNPRSASDSGKESFKQALRGLIMTLEAKENELHQEDRE